MCKNNIQPFCEITVLAVLSRTTANHYLDMVAVCELYYAILISNDDSMTILDHMYLINTIEFADGGKIRFNAPDFRLGGTMYGDRTIEGNGTVVFEDIGNNLKAVCILGTFEKTGFFGRGKTGNKTDFTGVMYQMNPKKITLTQFGKHQDLPTNLSKLPDLKTKVADF